MTSECRTGRWPIAAMLVVGLMLAVGFDPGVDLAGDDDAGWDLAAAAGPDSPTLDEEPPTGGLGLALFTPSTFAIAIATRSIDPLPGRSPLAALDVAPKTSPPHSA